MNDARLRAPQAACAESENWTVLWPSGSDRVYENDRRHNVVFSRQVIRSIEAMPGVRGAVVIQGVPMRVGSFYGSFSIEGRPDTPVGRPSARIRVVSP